MSCEVLVRTQNGKCYKEFRLPIEVLSKEEVKRQFEDDVIVNGYALFMGYDYIGEYKEEKHAVHVMNYLLSKRNFYRYDDKNVYKSVILNVPSDELVKQTPDENLLDGIPTKNEGKIVDKNTKNEGEG